MVGPADPLDQAFDVFGCADLNDQIDIAPVDPQIEAAGADDGAQLPGDHRALDPFPLFARQRPVVDADRQIVGIGQPQVVEKDLGLGAGVVKDQGGVVAFHLGQHRRNGVFCPAPGPWRAFFGDQHGNVGFGAGIGQQDVAGVGVAGQHLRDGCRIFHRRRQPDPAQAGGEGLQT